MSPMAANVGPDINGAVAVIAAADKSAKPPDTTGKFTKMNMVF